MQYRSLYCWCSLKLPPLAATSLHCYSLLDTSSLSYCSLSYFVGAVVHVLLQLVHMLHWCRYASWEQYVVLVDHDTVSVQRCACCTASPEFVVLGMQLDNVLADMTTSASSVLLLSDHDGAMAGSTWCVLQFVTCIQNFYQLPAWSTSGTAVSLQQLAVLA